MLTRARVIRRGPCLGLAIWLSHASASATLTRGAAGRANRPIDPRDEKAMVRTARAFARRRGRKVDGYSISVTVDGRVAHVFFDRPDGPPGDHFIVVVDLETGQATGLILGR
jgi:hypothetical protein